MSATATVVSKSTSSSSAANPVNSSSASATTTSTTNTVTTTTSATATSTKDASAVTATTTAPSIPIDLKEKIDSVINTLECNSLDFAKNAFGNIESALFQSFNGRGACEITQSQIDDLIKGLGSNFKELKEELVVLYSDATSYKGEMATIFNGMIGISHSAGDALVLGRQIVDELNAIYDEVNSKVNVNLQNASPKTAADKTLAVQHLVKSSKATDLKSAADRKTASDSDKSKSTQLAVIPSEVLGQQIQSAGAYANKAYSESEGLLSNIKTALKEGGQCLCGVIKAYVLLEELIKPLDQSSAIYKKLQSIKKKLEGFNTQFKAAVYTTAQLSLSVGASNMRGFRIKNTLQIFDQPFNIGADANPSNGANVLSFSKDGASAAGAKLAVGGAGPSNPSGAPSEPAKAGWCTIS